MPNRRKFLQTIPSVPALAALPANAKSFARLDYVNALGLRRFLNADSALGDGHNGFSCDASLITRFSLYIRFTFSMSRPGT